VEAQCENCFRNIARALEQAGAGLDDLVRVLIFVTSREEFERIMPIIRKHCYAARPANTTVFAQLVAAHMRVEIEAMARLR
jgi:enamine deaminase RidA (YjgF/YER057c/UK114 family)